MVKKAKASKKVLGLNKSAWSIISILLVAIVIYGIFHAVVFALAEGLSIIALAIVIWFVIKVVIKLMKK